MDGQMDGLMDRSSILLSCRNEIKLCLDVSIVILYSIKIHVSGILDINVLYITYNIGAELVRGEFSRGRVCQGPSLLGAQMS